MRTFPPLRPNARAVAVCAALAAAAVAPPARADDPTDIRAPDERDSATRWGLGVGLGQRTRPYAGVSNETRALPLLFLDNRYVRVAGTGVDFKLPSVGAFGFAARVRYAFDGYKPSDSPVLVGMERRRAGFWAGGAALWRTEVAVLSAELLADVSGRSKGSQFRLGADREFRFGAFSLTPHVSATWLDRKYVDYYYGVRGSEATAARAAYVGRSTVDTEIGLRSGFALAPNQRITLDVGTTVYGKGITDSPLVERRSTTGVRVGYLYAF